MPSTYTYSGPIVINVTRWIFFDPTDSSTDEFELNPTDQSLPKNRTIATKSRRFTGAKTVIVTNSQGIEEFSFDGTILTETMYNLFTLWFNKGHPIEITDDLGRTFSVYITKFTPRRELRKSVPWFHTYTVTGILV